MIVFLTGDRQIGKSTAIQRFLTAFPQLRLGGYFTRSAGMDVYMLPASAPRDVLLSEDPSGEVFSAAGGFPVGKRRIGGFPEAFDTKGAELLRNSGNADLIILDEIGWMEEKADIFSSEILRLVHSGKNILGVIRKGCSTALCRELHSLPSVTNLELNESNRDQMPETLAEYFRRNI